MGDFLFVVKCSVATCVILVFMQMRIGGRTVEQQTMRWIRNSSAVEELRLVAEGAVKSGQVGYQKASNYFGEGSEEVNSGKWYELKRSDAYYRQKAQEEREERREARREAGRAAASTSASSED
ncbi:MAG: hypothetical protein V4692_05910 [Bdellovibrionota bacterium]